MITLHDLADTERLGRLIGNVATPGDVLVLTGELGAGKTTLTKGIALGLEIQQMIKSPTYTIIREYETGRLPLYHMDIYRVEGDTDELGLEEYFEGDGLAVVEWGQLLSEPPVDYVELVIEVLDHERTVSLTAHGQQSAAFVDRIMKEWQA
ncbi:YjeE family ATPase [Enterococcus canis]|uniref:tRNA threonylcarbamoyladenosine biosynthesis protein TsaE n=1 Tax=Enterococcus canis TaxID=214095 RepID=A0A1L8RFR4_9ENTE|nr:tRNA (adenosine(37)-N6)-threonylcarbamoyltransferase complex ATPase subunit type 1 TsaE [Enterococcus canis]OJG18616.1 YjeE family ATPase [Enterococcus canis]